MPRYAFLASSSLNTRHIRENMRVLKIEGVPYSDEMIARADDDIKAQLSPEDPSAG